MKNTPNSFEQYLFRQKADPEFLKRFEKAGQAWEVALQISRLREAAGLSQSELAGRLETSQQQISRLESPSYEGHSLSMLRRVASALGAELQIRFEPIGEARPANTETSPSTAAESPAPYRRPR